MTSPFPNFLTPHPTHRPPHPAPSCPLQPLLRPLPLPHTLPLVPPNLHLSPVHHADLSSPSPPPSLPSRLRWKQGADESGPEARAELAILKAVVLDSDQIVARMPGSDE